MGNIDWVNLLFGFSGRINRAKFWIAVLVYVIVNIVMSLIQYALGSFGAILAGLVAIAIFISGIAVALKRLHDRNRPGWWLVIFYVAPVVLAVLASVLAVAGLVSEGDGTGVGIFASILYLAAGAIGIWAFVELGCLRGTVGPNQYGPDPLALAVPA
jgi:uncharacterized membrane protein YhaH (DUF805 family)